MATIFDTSFPGADVNPIPTASAPFAKLTGVADMQRISNTAAVASASTFAAYFDDSNSYPADHSSEITIGTLGGGDFGPAVRCAGGSCYFVQCANGVDIALYKYVSGGFNLIQNISGQNYGVAGNRIRLEATGTSTTSLKVFRNDVQVNATYNDSSTPLTTGKPGMSGYDGTFRISRLVTGDFSVPGPSITVQPEGEAAAVGATAQFAVTATGGALTYQWQQSTDRGETWASASGGSGGTTATYTTPAASSTTNGTKYRVVVTDENGSRTSESAWFFTSGLPNTSRGSRGIGSSWAVRLPAAGARTPRGIRALRPSYPQTPQVDGFALAWQDWFLPATDPPPPAPPPPLDQKPRARNRPGRGPFSKGKFFLGGANAWIWAPAAATTAPAVVRVGGVLQYKLDAGPSDLKVYVTSSGARVEKLAPAGGDTLFLPAYL